MRIVGWLLVAAVVAVWTLAFTGGCRVQSQEPIGQRGGSNPAHVTKTPFASDGTPADAILPVELHMRNTGGSDGEGLCVFTSLEMVARSLNARELYGFQQWMRKKPGGGWPGKVDQMIAAYCDSQREPAPAYFQVQANDLDLLKKALKSGRPTGITYSRSPTGRYNGQRISHMVMLAAAGKGKGPDGKGWWAVVDNNYPGSWEWMSEAQFLSAAAGGGRLWAVILTNPSAPPPPAN